MSAKRGTCSVCPMEGHLRADGTVPKHLDKTGSKRRYDRVECKGSGKAPRSAR